MKQYVIIALIAVGCFLLGTLMPRSAKIQKKVVVEYRDTSYSRLSLGDVKTLDIPEVKGVPSVLFVPEVEIRTIVKDSIRYVILDRQHKVLEKDDVKIWYSGIDPTIDSLQVRRQTVIQKEPWKRHKIGLEAEAGYYGNFGLMTGGTYEYNLFKWLSVSAKFGYNFYIEKPYVAAGLNISLYSW